MVDWPVGEVVVAVDFFLGFVGVVNWDFRVTAGTGCDARKLKVFATTGADASAPYPPSSITHSTTYSGWATGPKPTNQEFGSSVGALLAVPVLPATSNVEREGS